MFTLLALNIPMTMSIKFDTVKSGRSIIYIEVSQVIVAQSFLKIDFNLANSADEMPHQSRITFRLVLMFVKIIAPSIASHEQAQ